MSDPIPQNRALEDVRGVRADLHSLLVDLELALAGPAERDPLAWHTQITQELTELRDVFGTHVEVTEGAGGLFEDIVDHAPRLAGPVGRFRTEHGDIEERMAALFDLLDMPPAEVVPHVDEIRVKALRLLGDLARHRQHGSDLIYEAYEVDIGGE